MKNIEIFNSMMRCLCGDTNNNTDLKRKQKVLAESVDSMITLFPSNPLDDELIRCLKTLTRLHKESDLPGNLLASSGLKLDQFPNYKDMILEYTKQKIELEDVQNYISLSQILSKDITVDKDIDETINELMQLKSSSDYNVSDKFFEIISKKYVNTIKKNLEDSTEMRISDSIFDSTLSSLKEIATNKFITPSKFNILDQYYLKGGFESGRIYIFGGKPGGGKSTILLNLLANIVCKKSRKQTDKKGAVVYITLENDISETYDRYFSMLIRKNTKTKDLTEDDRLTLKNIFSSEDSCEKIVKYMNPFTESTVDILRYVESLTSEYNVKSILVDYLDLLRSSQSISEKRFELGQVTAELRVIAKKFSCPVITATQLNTAGYRGIPTMSNVDESRQKVQNADFVGLLFDIDLRYLPTRLSGEFDPRNFRLLGVNVDKNRDGQTGKIVFGYHTDIFYIESFNKTDTDSIMASYYNSLNYQD